MVRPLRVSREAALSLLKIDSHLVSAYAARRITVVAWAIFFARRPAGYLWRRGAEVLLQGNWGSLQARCG